MPCSASTRRSAASTARKSGRRGSVITCGGTPSPRWSPRRTAGSSASCSATSARASSGWRSRPAGSRCWGSIPTTAGAPWGAAWPRPCWSTSGSRAPGASALWSTSAWARSPASSTRSASSPRPCAPSSAPYSRRSSWRERPMSVRTVSLPKKFHDAVERWRDAFIPDYGFLMENWEKHFPREPRFELCAYRELGMCAEVECGVDKGKPKPTRAAELSPEQAHHVLAQIRAQASTEFGSIQQHRLTLARAQDEEEQFWILRMMAEELRHGYQMLHLLAEDDWSSVSKDSSADMVEEVLSMTTGSLILGAFNIDFDSFVDNVVF